MHFQYTVADVKPILVSVDIWHHASSPKWVTRKFNSSYCGMPVAYPAFFCGGNRQFAELCGAHIIRQGRRMACPAVLYGGDVYFFFAVPGKINVKKGIIPLWRKVSTAKEKVPTISDWDFSGDPYENRTRVTAVKGRCLNRLTNGPYI